jgi:hypothetical protein
MLITNLTNENFLFESARHYRNIQVSSTEEFLSDLKRLKYLKKIITRYSTSGLIDERLVLNHIIILYNVFGAEFLARMLILKMYNQMKYLKPFLLYLNILPNVIKCVNEKNFSTVEFPMDVGIIDKLREIDKFSKKS